MGLYRVIVEPASGGKFEYSLPSGAYVLGREPDSCDIPIASPEISRRHAQLVFSEAHCEVTDLGSTSGTSHKGALLHGARPLPYPLELTLGTCKISVEQDENTKSFHVDQLDSASQPASHYTQGKMIAKGGMGAVMEANDQLLGRTVAMKIILPDIGGSESMRLRFIREATVLARLEHPGIVPIYELGRDAGGELFYAMKKVEGRTLQAIIDDIRNGDQATIKEFTLDRLLTIFRKICDAMAFAHAKGVIHRDLKPENVMVGAFGEALVMDWGLAKVLHDVAQTAAEFEQIQRAAESSGIDPLAADSSLEASDWLEDALKTCVSTHAELTMDGSVMGSPQYMSPEQAEGRVSRIDERSDIFSLGGILYAILTLHPPVEGRTVQEVLNNVKSGQIIPHYHFSTEGKELRDGDLKAGKISVPKETAQLPHCPGGCVPAPLSAVAMKALANSQGDRYDNVRLLSQDVEAYQGGFATSAEEINLWGLFLLRVKRHKGIAVSAGIAAVLLAAVTVGFVFRVKAEQRAAEAEALRARTAETAAGEAEDLALQRERETKEALAASTLALAESAYRGFDLAAMTRALDETPKAFRDSSWHYLADKRDSSLGLFRLPDLGDISTGAPIPGKPGQFLLAGTTGALHTVDVRERKSLRRLNTGVAGAKRLAISGDGKRVALGRIGGREVTVFELSDRTRIQTLPVEKEGTLWSLALNHDGSRLAIGHVTRGSNGGLALYALNREQPLWSVRQGVPGDIFLHPDGELVLVGNYHTRKLVFHSAADGKTLRSFNHQVQCMAPNADGTKVALGCMLGTAVIVDSKTGRKIQAGRLHQGTIVDLAWTTGNTLVTVGLNGFAHRIALWGGDDFSSQGFLFGLNTRQRNQDILLDPAGGYLLSLRDEPRLWRVPVDIEIGKIDIRSEQGMKASFVSDETLIASRLWSTAAYDLSAPSAPKVTGPERLGNSHTISASHWNTGLFAVGSREREKTSIQLHFMEDGIPKLRWKKTIGENTQNLDFAPSGERLMVCSVGANVRILSVDDGEVLQSFKAPLGFFLGKNGSRMAAIIPKARRADRAKDEAAIVELPSGKILHSRGWNSKLNCLAVSIERNLVAVAGDEQTVTLLDGEALEVRNHFRAHDQAITSLAFHPILPILASGSGDGSVKLWNIHTGAQVDLFMGIRGIPLSLVFSPSGHLLAVQGKENVVRIFDVDHLKTAIEETSVAETR